MVIEDPAGDVALSNIFSGIALKGTKLTLMIIGKVDKVEETEVRVQIIIGMSVFHSLLIVKPIFHSPLAVKQILQ